MQILELTLLSMGVLGLIMTMFSYANKHRATSDVDPAFVILTIAFWVATFVLHYMRVHPL